uniref:Uncharacterized protein n=1 Tax=Arundo donax TaxID=35708 RepID=A0A0A9AX63_ARUDO
MSLSGSNALFSRVQTTTVAENVPIRMVASVKC